MFHSIRNCRVLICLLSSILFFGGYDRSSQLVEANHWKDAAQKVGLRLKRPGPKEEVVQVEKAEEDKSWEIPHYRVYSRKEYLKPQEVLGLLKELEEIYKNKSEEETNGRKWRVRNLVAACEFGHTKCNHQHFTRIDKLIEYNTPFMLNVVPYLRYCREQQYQFCADELQELNRIDIEEDLNEEERIGMGIINEKLLAMLNKENDEEEPITVVELPVYPEYITQAFYEYFDENIRFDKHTTKCKWRLKKVYRRRFEQFVGDLCVDVTNALDLTLFMFDEDESIKDRLDPIGRQWLTNARICRYIIGFMDETVRDTYKLAIKKLQPGIFNRIARRLCV